MSEKLIRFLERYLNMIDEYRQFVVDTVMGLPNIDELIAKRRKAAAAAE